VDLDYTVTRDGRVEDITVSESNAPRGIEMNVVRDLRVTRFRPRFLDGEPVDTAVNTTAGISTLHAARPLILN
jgi:outer membrane biosynthesis protein TonB